MPSITHSHLFRRPLAAALLALVALTPGLMAQTQAFPFMDAKLSLDQRLDDLLGRLTLPELQVGSSSKDIRLTQPFTT